MKTTVELPDALAALCLSHQIQELWTADRDFPRFPALRVRDPLVGPRHA